MIGYRGGRCVVLVLAVVVLAACSRGDDGDGAAGRRRAAGPPVVVGLVNMENAPVGSFPELREGAQAAATYLNEELGGVEGRPIRLEVCTTNGAPQSSQACANQLLQRRPVAVLGGVDLGSAAALPVLEQAGVPYVGGSPTRLEELVSPMSFMLTGGTAAELLGEAEYLTATLGAKKVGLLHVDLPGLVADAVAGARTILSKRGVTSVKVVAEKADAADFTPALTAVTAGAPDAVVAVFPAQGCSRVMQARAALGVRARMFYPGACADERVLQAGGAGAQRALFATGYVPFSDTSNSEVATYREKLRRYGPRDAAPSVLSQTGFSVLMAIRDLLVEIDGAPTAQALTERLRAARGHRSFMGHPFTCDGEQVTLLASVCSAHVRIVEYRDGRFTDVARDWVNGAGLIRLVLG